jgi:signal transduction histidine kinase
VQALARAGQLDAGAQERYLGDAAESARLLLSNARRVAQLVLNFKQLAVDRVSEARQRFDLHELLQDCIRDLQPKVDEAGVDVSIEVAPGIQLESYPVALAQVVTNLVINSLQHAFRHGTAEGRITICATAREEDEVRIEYSDDGQGIDPALESKVFDPFFTTRRMLGGSGLGLYIVNQIVTRQLGGGVRFVMQFPRVARHSPNVGRILGTSPGTSVDAP